MARNNNDANRAAAKPSLDVLFAGMNQTASIFDQPAGTNDVANGTPNAGMDKWLKTSADSPQTLVSRIRAKPRPLDLDGVNWSTAYKIRAAVASRLSDQIRERLQASGSTAITPEDRRQMGVRLINDEVRTYQSEAILDGRPAAEQISATDIDRYVKAVDSSIFGYGRWQPYMEDEEFENFEIRGLDAFMTYPDKIVEVPPVADSHEELIAQLQYLATYSPTPRQFSRLHPEMTLNLEDRYRLHAYAFDVIDRPSIVIRQHKFPDADLDRLVQWEMITPELAPFLKAAIRGRLATVVSGDQGAGKTTFLRALAMAIPPLEAVGVIESDAELFLHKLPGRRRFINLVARDGLGEAMGVDGRPVGEYSLQQHFQASRRQNLTRTIVGEVLGPEAPAMFQSMQASAGSLSTIHSQHAKSTIERLVTAAALGDLFTQADAYRQIAVNIKLIIHIGTRDTRGTAGGRLHRFVEEIVAIDGFADGINGGTSFLPATSTLYEYGERLRTEAIPEEMNAALRAGGWMH